jgi:hypothetical protein
MPTETARRFRDTGRDDFGNVLVRRVLDAPGGPCRHCLRLGAAGETMLLGSYDLPRPRGIYWAPSPVFLHERDCPRFEAEDEIAPIVLANPLVSVRSYDRDGMCLYDLGQVCAGADAAAPLAAALADPRTDFVNVHTARPGCLLALVERLPDRGEG